MFVKVNVILVKIFFTVTVNEKVVKLPLVKFISYCNKMCNETSISIHLRNVFLCLHVNHVENEIFLSFS